MISDSADLGSSHKHTWANAGVVIDNKRDLIEVGTTTAVDPYPAIIRKGSDYATLQSQPPFRCSLLESSKVKMPKNEDRTGCLETPPFPSFN
jgi:hypothetical protein